MKLETILNLPDSREKFLKLEKNLLKLQPHGELFFKGIEEFKRLYDVYRENDKNAPKV